MNYYDDHCLNCDKDLKNGTVYFTMEFDAWICKECHDHIMNDKNLNDQELCIREEWK